MVEADPLVRVRLDVSYDGTDFSGWAVQPGRRTVQDELQKALATVLRLPSVALTVAGRTDAGVHATGQVAHCDLPLVPDPKLLTRLADAEQIEVGTVQDVDKRGHDLEVAQAPGRGPSQLRRPGSTSFPGERKVCLRARGNPGPGTLTSATETWK